MADNFFQFRSPGDLRITLDRVDFTPVEASLAASHAAYQLWKHTTPDERMAALKAIEADLKANAETLALGISIETGKPLLESRGEVGAVIGKFALTIKDAGEYNFLTPKKIEGGPFEAEIRMIPRGPAVIISPFNFPLHLANGAIVPHLLAGNTVIFKPSPIGAIVSAKYAAIFQKHLPEGVFEVVQGDGATGSALCTDPRVRAICFTGSVNAGRAIAQAVAGDFSKSLALEMGGKNALILLEDGDAGPAAKAAADGMCATTGQRCNDTSRVIVHKSKAEEFCAALVEELKRYVPGDPCSERTTLGALVNEAAHKRYADALKIDGDKWIVKGASLAEVDGRPGYYASPSVRYWKDYASAMKCPIIGTEIFAPLLDVFVAESNAEILALHDATPFGLAASVFTSSRYRFEEMARELSVGNLYANIPTTFSPSILPFGGCKLSGNGKPAGRGFIRFTSDEQAVQFGKGITNP
jgi:acyl-CoA reductase-like NAD-dependent aldehyde dehydrogenase